MARKLSVATPDRVSAITDATGEVHVLADLIEALGYAPRPSTEALLWMARQLHDRMEAIEDAIS